MQIESFAMIREMIRKDKSVKNTIIKQFFGISYTLNRGRGSGYIPARYELGRHATCSTQ